MASPSLEVLTTFELLDMILSNLATRDLLAAQRVNYIFNQVITKSRKMQKTKYLLPETLQGLPTIGHLQQTNPLYLQRFVQQAAFHALRQVNPTVHFLGMDRFVLQRVEAFQDPEASWRKMLLFQPRASLAIMTPMSVQQQGNRVCILRNEEGLMMADVVSHFEELAKAAGDGIDLLSATVIRKMVWSITPVAQTIETDIA
jgi:hypothetical protein